MINPDKIDQRLVKALEQNWSEETGGVFVEDNPAKYQCAVTALVVQDYYGGKLVRGRVVGDTKVSSHYWNELPDGTIVDLTRQQFGDDYAEKGILIVEESYRDRDYVLNAPGSDTKKRYQILKDRVCLNM